MYFYFISLINEMCIRDSMETAIKDVYAIGDIRVKQIRQVSTAVSDGTIAAINAAKNRF